MTSLAAALFPALAPFVILMALAGAVWLGSRHRTRRSPLTRDLLRSPGHSLLMQIEDLSERIDSFVFVAAVVPLSSYASYITQKYWGAVKPGSHIGIFYLIISVGFVAFAAVRLPRLVKERRSFRLGLDCEMAVGQELTALCTMATGSFTTFLLMGSTSITWLWDQTVSLPLRPRAGQSPIEDAVSRTRRWCSMGRIFTFPTRASRSLSLRREGRQDGFPSG